MSKVTITQIAERLGITPSTVSRALAGSERVKEQTRELVEQTAQEMGYERNEMAASLRKGTVLTVGIVVPRINRQFFSSVISGAESILNDAGYTVIISQTHETLEGEIRALRTMRRNRVAGVIMSHTIESSCGQHVADILGEDVRLVQFDRVYNELSGAKIVNDNFKGAYSATSKLIEQGYRHIGTLAGYMTCSHYVDRLEGYRQALLDAGMIPSEELIFPDSIVTETGTQSALKAIERGCDALYCAGDFSALGALTAAEQKGLRVPEEFGIIGTANENFTALTSPTLSSLEMSPKEMGRTAAQAFLDGDDSTITIPMRLIQRNSSNKHN